jgi:UDP-N-acetylmuramoyl-tripeptide--D-alanyl-D-alanine ligase
MRLNVSRSERLTIIDDSYNANPSSAAAALEVLQRGAQGRRVYVIGDMLELGSDASKFHQELGRQIASAGIEVLVAVGDYRDALIEGARSASRLPQTISYEDTQAAILDLPDRLHESDTVLIKGSRRVGLDQLVRRLRQRFEQRPENSEMACDSGSQQRVG